MGSQAQAMGYQNLGVPMGRLTVALLLFVLLTMLIPLRDMQDKGSHGPMGLWKFSLVHLKPFSLESIRSLGWVLLFLPLLIIPGIIKYLQFLMVPYVVLCDPKYQAGEIDALAESARLMKGLVSIAMIFLILSIPLVMWFGQFTEPILITNEPLKWFLSFAITSAFSLYFNLLLYKLYRVRMVGQKEKLDGSNIQ